MPSAYQPANFFVLRTPLLPVDAFRSVTEPRHPDEGQTRDMVFEQLQTLFARPVVAESLYVAAPALFASIATWRADDRGAPARRIGGALLRYLVRMTTRPTPFGLFAGCSLGTIGGARTELNLSEQGCYRRYARLDMRIILELVEHLEAQPSIRAKLQYYTNPDIYTLGGRLRFSAGRTVDGERHFEHGTLESDAELDSLLAAAKVGATPETLAQGLFNAGLASSCKEAAAFVEEVIDARLLVSELEPTVTGPDPRIQLEHRLAAAGVQAEAATLATIGDAINGLNDSSLGVDTNDYEIGAQLEQLGVELAAPHFHVELRKPTVNATVGHRPLRALSEATDILARLALHRVDPDLKAFREGLISRDEAQYELASVPLSRRRGVSLLELLDPDGGIGFGDAAAVDPDPLLEGLDLPDPRIPTSRFGSVERHQLRAVERAAVDGRSEWCLSKDDIEALSIGAECSFPDAVAVTASLVASNGAAADAGQFEWQIRNVQGPSGINRMARFCHGEPQLADHVRSLQRMEESLRPDALYVDLVHLPPGREANLVCRPLFGRHELSYLGSSGAPLERRVALDDVRVTLAGERIVLFSASLGVELIPRLSTSHDHKTSALPLYRFLGALQNMRESRDLGWSWGPLADAPWLPRVRWQHVVLSPATWKLDETDLAPLALATDDEAHREAIGALRDRLQLPRWVAIADHDNILPLDLDNLAMVDQLKRRGRSGEIVPLIELSLEQDELLVHGPEGRFSNEMVVPLMRKAPTSDQSATIPERRTRSTARKHCFAPGSSWLYAKLYMGPESVDALLLKVIAPLVKRLRSEGLHRWFFIRYGDPEWHLRLRFHGEPAWLSAVALPALHDALEPWMESGGLRRLMLDTYEPELERYGGPSAVGLAESLFEVDSDTVLSLLAGLDLARDPELRWRVALLGAHQLLVDLGLSLTERDELMRQTRSRFATEFHVDVANQRTIGLAFRARREELFELLTNRNESASGIAAVGLDDRTLRTAPLIAELRRLESEGKLLCSVAALAPSLVHMFCNRILRDNQRSHELILYDHLSRIYRSQLARR